jgi:hypothetical protein
MTVDTNYVLDDDGHWVTRQERASQLAKRGILYGGFSGDSKAQTTVVRPGPNKWIYLPYEGFDRKKFPNTFRTLLLFYSLPDWWKGTNRPGPYPDLMYDKKEETPKQEEETWDYEYYE